MQYRTRRITIEGRQVPIQTTKFMDDMLVAALGARTSMYRTEDKALRGRSFWPLAARDLVQADDPGWRSLTPAGVQLATMIRDERLNPEPVKRPEYRVRPEITAHDRVTTLNDIVTVNTGTDRWRVDEIDYTAGVAYLRPETAPEDAQGMWVALTLTRPVLDAQRGAEGAGA
jgi:hypothetical protein